MGLYSRARRVRLIFNPFSGALRRQRPSLEDVGAELRALGFRPQASVVEPGGSIAGDVREALRQGFRLFAVCGGDGTVSAVAGALAGARAAMAVIPTGSQNNLAYSLGIPEDFREAAALLKTGKHARVDVGEAAASGGRVRFLETCAVGLVSALSPSGEAIQHGDLAHLGEFLGTLIASEPADLELRIDGRTTVCGRGHIALAANMPVIGFHYRCGSVDSWQDGKLEVLFFEGLSKLELVAFAARGMRLSEPDDPRIRKLCASTLEIAATPPMPVMADGMALGESPVKITVLQKALTVFVPK